MWQYHGIQACKPLETSTGSQRPLQPLTPDIPIHHQRIGKKVSGLRGVHRESCPWKRKPSDFPTFHQLALAAFTRHQGKYFWSLNFYSTSQVKKQNEARYGYGHAGWEVWWGTTPRQESAHCLAGVACPTSGAEAGLNFHFTVVKVCELLTTSWVSLAPGGDHSFPAEPMHTTLSDKARLLDFHATAEKDFHAVAWN